MNEVDLVKEAWDIKKIIIAVAATATVAVGGYAGKQYFFDDKKAVVVNDELPKQQGTVEGARTDQEGSQKNDSKKSGAAIGSDIQNVVQEKVVTIREQVSQLNPAEIATSSPQIQRILNDIHSIEYYPKNQAKEMCENICRGL